MPHRTAGSLTATNKTKLTRTSVQPKLQITTDVNYLQIEQKLANIHMIITCLQWLILASSQS